MNHLAARIGYVEPMERDMNHPANVLLKDGTYRAARAAAREIDVNVMLDDGEYLLGWLGVSAEGVVGEYVASPRFASLDALDRFCDDNRAHYEQASQRQYEQGACLSPNQWWWSANENAPPQK